ncbi:sensor histidine kinase [Nonomuraea gerenzanensis]|uniref:histidine kinase n=1 Tax=Nonomuraea gerenzanensis TaxID=93944 RepID=A0A1M4E2I0_9ACTN|nr:nitrate- and nitrite sensing domain-containing protein [Nonomuraea gerenzanensis]UBU15254.1 nitrate- and nitrite sensing domain-containing protein [Nonomuraea gerenzanensis]SBO92997.1 signal transduction histidine kinase [Nonomuraea gerenzanensis]
MRQDRGKRSLSRLGLRNWRVRWRLTALILVPTIAAVVLGGTRVVESVQSIDVYDRTATAAEQAGHIRDLVQAIGLERDTGGWIGANRAMRKELAADYTQRKAAVDSLVKTVRADLATMDDSYGPRVVRAAGQAKYDLSRLSKIRTEGQTETIRYDFLTDTLLDLHDELALMSDDSQIVGQFRALSALASAKEEMSRQRVQLIQNSYNPNRTDAKDVEQFIASNAVQQSEIASVGAEAGVEVGLRLSKALTSKQEYVNVQLTKARAIALVSSREPGARITENLISARAERLDWFNQNTAAIDVLHNIEKDLASRVSLRSQELRSTETRSAIIAGSLIVALLIIVLLLTVAIARSMVGPLRRLRTEALEVAGFRLPDVVRQLRVSGDTTVRDVAPIEVEGNDEIGEVARAFDQVHRQAVRLAGEEAELRSNISSMFVNLSRRTQTLVERQISLIDGLEKGEQDGGRLADLFKLDHLATRMRRNSENLLVLAGHEATRRRSQPAKLVDVVRAALSEVEGYERVQVKVHRATSVLGSCANDLVHLVAELVENAIQFSPNNSQVTVTSSLIEGGGALLSVSDTGISMTEEELAEANRRLAEPPVVDVSVSRRMGLFVVGRLALRHGIRVQLRKGEGAGLIAMVLLPPALIADGTQQPLPQRPAFGGGTVPSQPAPPLTPPAQNGSFRSFASFDSFEAGPGTQAPPYQNGRPRHAGPPSGPFDSGTPAQGTGPFNSGAPGRRPGAFDTGTPAQGTGAFDSGAYNSLPGRQGPRTYDSTPGLPRPGAGSFNSDPGRAGISGFTADTDGGSYRRQPPSHDTGSYPSFPSAPAHPSGNGAFQTPPPSFQTPPPSFPTNDVRQPDPAPSVEVSPLEQEQEEFLPIFASVESAWFRRPQGEAAPQPAGAGEPGGEPSSAQAVPSGEEAWRTAADAGWQAAARASEPSLGGITAAGLPKRTPKANLVPGTASKPAPAQQPQRQAPMPPVSADRMRSRMASYQQGVRRGRQEVRGQEERSE